MSVIFLICSLVYIGLLIYVLTSLIAKGKIESILWFIILFLPFYITFQSFAYQQTESELVVRFIQYSKEVLFLIAVCIWLFYRKNIFEYRFKITLLDKLFIGFLGISFVYLILPIGPSLIINKAIYFKNILVMGLMYFFGRNADLSGKEIRGLVTAIIAVTLIAFVVVVFEDVSNQHVHSLLGLANFNEDLHNIEPSGHYGLTWTFEAQDQQKRFGSIFSNPLEFASSLLFSFSIAIFYLLYSRHWNNKLVYGGLLIITIICVLLAYSRASFISYLAIIFFVSILAKWYRLILGGVLLTISLIFYISYLAPKEIKYYVEDTLTFQNTSSITHLIDWVQAVESMTTNPMGIGLATSGNAGGVDLDNIVGGENQFLIYGVQLGWIGFTLYLLMTIFAIVACMRAFRRTTNLEDKVIPFVAACVKFGFLLPLLTANAESYLFIAYLSWWMVGYSVQKSNILNNTGSPYEVEPG